MGVENWESWWSWHPLPCTLWKMLVCFKDGEIGLPWRDPVESESGSELTMVIN